MNSFRYRDLLTEHLLPELEKDGNRVKVIIQQDNARIHTLNVMKAFFEQEGIIPPWWPAKSPDLSPIENAWGIIKYHLKKLRLQNVEDIAPAVEKLWRTLITPKLCHRLFQSVPNRIDRVLKAGGARIKDSSR